MTIIKVEKNVHNFPLVLEILFQNSDIYKWRWNQNFFIVDFRKTPEILWRQIFTHKLKIDGN